MTKLSIPWPLVAVALCAVGFFWDPSLNIPDQKPNPDTPIPVVTPTGDLLAFKTALEAHPKVAADLETLYAELAEQIGRDEELIVTTSDIEQANGLAGSLMFQKTGVSVPGVSEAAAAVVKAKIGDDSVELTPQLRQAAVTAFRELSAAAGQAK